MNRGARDGPLYPHLLCHCDVPAVYRQCKNARNPSRIGKMLYRCRYYPSDKSCKYTQWEDQYIAPPRQVICRCGQEACCQVSKQPRSRGEKFYSCRYWQDKKRNCEYFLWHAQLLDINPAPVQRGNQNVIMLHDPQFHADHGRMAAPYKQDNIRVRGTTLGPRQKEYKGIWPLPKESVRNWADDDFSEPSEDSAQSSETSDYERVEPSGSEDSFIDDDSCESDQSDDGFIVNDYAEIEYEDSEAQPMEFTTPHRCTRSGRGYTRDGHDEATTETINLVTSSESHAGEEADDESSGNEQEDDDSDSDQSQHQKAQRRLLRRKSSAPPAPKKRSYTRSKLFPDLEDESESSHDEEDNKPLLDRSNGKEPQKRKKMMGIPGVKRQLKRKKVEGTRRLFRNGNDDSGFDSPSPLRQESKRTKFAPVIDDSLSDLSV